MDQQISSNIEMCGTVDEAKNVLGASSSISIAEPLTAARRLHTRQPAAHLFSLPCTNRRRIRPRHHGADAPAARLACDEARTARIGGEDQGCNWQRRAVHECVKSTLTGVSFFGVECCACKMSMYSFVLECEVR